MKKILSISNSFGHDGTRYLYGITRSLGKDAKVVCLYIGGCSLYRHYRNMLSDGREYPAYLNGRPTGFNVSLKDALLSDEWDVVTFQQASRDSANYDSYQPFLAELSAYVSKLAPCAKQLIHSTWAYSDKSIAAKTNFPYKSNADFSRDIRTAYRKAAESIRADAIIPSTTAMERLYSEIGDAAYKDGAHASVGVGQYMLALVWYMTIFGGTIDGLAFNDFDVDVSDEERRLAEHIAIEVCAANDYKRV